MRKSLTTEQFIEKARITHGSRYDYSKSVWTGAQEKLEVICPVHGSFWVAGSAHCNTGMGCNACRSNRGTVFDFVAKARIVHGNRYSYDNVEYHSAKVQVTVKCALHGNFRVLPDSHTGVKAVGCPKCTRAGYRQDIPGFLYVLRHENLTKVGITNRLPYKRVEEIRLSSGLPFEKVSSVKFQDGAEALALETQALRWLRQNYEPHNKKYQGSSEVFVGVDLHQLLSKISEMRVQLTTSTKEI